GALRLRADGRGPAAGPGAAGPRRADRHRRHRSPGPVRHHPHGAPRRRRRPERLLRRWPPWVPWADHHPVPVRRVAPRRLGWVRRRFRRLRRRRGIRRFRRWWRVRRRRSRAELVKGQREEVPSTMDPLDSARKLTAELDRLLGGRLRSVVVYGSVARGEAIEGVSDVNVLVLLDRVDPETLRRLSPVAQKWAGAGITPPLLMAWPEWRRGADAFASELADMKDAHVMVHGEDPLRSLDVDPVELRLQAEH